MNSRADYIAILCLKAGLLRILISGHLGDEHEHHDARQHRLPGRLDPAVLRPQPAERRS